MGSHLYRPGATASWGRWPHLHPTLQQECLRPAHICREALCHGSQGWCDYNLSFSQQTAADHTLPWNTLRTAGSDYLWTRMGPGLDILYQCTAVSITFVLSVPYSTSNHLLVGPQYLTRLLAPGKTTACPGTGVHVSSPPTAHHGICVSPVCNNIRPGTALAHLITPYKSVHPSYRWWTPATTHRYLLALPLLCPEPPLPYNHADLCPQKKKPNSLLD